MNKKFIKFSSSSYIGGYKFKLTKNKAFFASGLILSSSLLGASALSVLGVGQFHSAFVSTFGALIGSIIGIHLPSLFIDRGFPRQKKIWLGSVLKFCRHKKPTTNQQKWAAFWNEFLLEYNLGEYAFKLDNYLKIFVKDELNSSSIDLMDAFKKTESLYPGMVREILSSYSPIMPTVATIISKNSHDVLDLFEATDLFKITQTDLDYFPHLTRDKPGFLNTLEPVIFNKIFSLYQNQPPPKVILDYLTLACHQSCWEKLNILKNNVTRNDIALAINPPLLSKTAKL